MSSSKSNEVINEIRNEQYNTIDVRLFFKYFFFSIFCWRFNKNNIIKLTFAKSESVHRIMLLLQLYAALITRTKKWCENSFDVSDCGSGVNCTANSFS